MCVGLLGNHAASQVGGLYYCLWSGYCAVMTHIYVSVYMNTTHIYVSVYMNTNILLACMHLCTYIQANIDVWRWNSTASPTLTLVRTTLVDTSKNSYVYWYLHVHATIRIHTCVRTCISPVGNLPMYGEKPSHAPSIRIICIVKYTRARTRVHTHTHTVYKHT